MLIEERHVIILDYLKKKGVAKLNEFVKITNASESTIRRDLAFLESVDALKRIHGGAKIINGILEEPSYKEKEVQNIDEKKRIARYAASLISDGDSIYLDAGTSTFEMIQYMNQKNITVVTNGLKHSNFLIENDNINAYILGGKIKTKTRAIVGLEALKELQKFRFDKCFLGVNGVHVKYGYTTPDSEEAILKECAIKYSREAFILADESKFEQVSFIKIAEVGRASIITGSKIDNYGAYAKKTNVKVVKK